MKTKTHETVSRAYTQALEHSQKGQGGCCGPSTGEASLSTVAQSASYGADAAKYTSAAASSFGCGNPLSFAGVKEGDVVVDLGSGAGLDLLIASEKVGPSGQVIGVDMTDAMIEAARKNASEAGADNIEVRKGLIEQLPIETGSVDWVISNCVINLSPDKPAVFREIARVLKPGGRFAVSDIVAHDLPDWIRNNADAYAACLAGAISEEDYLAGLKDAGMQSVEVTDRLVYDADQLKGIVSSDMGNLAVDRALLDVGATSVAGKVWSAKIVGQKEE